MVPAAIGTDLIRFILREERRYPNASGSLSLALVALEHASKEIAAHVRKAGLANVLGKTGETNVQGEEVQKLDDLANELMIDHLGDSGLFYALLSEETEEPIFCKGGEDARYIIAFDPLDGSSNIDVNVSIGTIFSIFLKSDGTGDDFLQKGENLVAAGYVVYGSSVMLVYSTGNGVNGFTLDPSVGMYLLSHPNIQIPTDTKIYSINEAYEPRWREGLRAGVRAMKHQGFSSRYIGSMVADVHRTLIKGGAFIYPADAVNPEGKLRYLYEVAPMSFLIEQAGGRADTGSGPALRVCPRELHQRCPIYLGSKSIIDGLMSVL